jgi:hypothetical protein
MVMVQQLWSNTSSVQPTHTLPAEKPAIPKFNIFIGTNATVLGTGTVPFLKMILLL